MITANQALQTSLENITNMYMSKLTDIIKIAASEGKTHAYVTVEEEHIHIVHTLLHEYGYAISLTNYPVYRGNYDPSILITTVKFHWM